MFYINYIFEEERWMDIVDARIKDRYQVSDRGRVRNKTTGYIMQLNLKADGYYHINLQKKDSYKGNCSRRINRLVLKAFNPTKHCDSLVANHLDLNKLNNILTNLRWCTQEENLLHAKQMGALNIHRGEAAPNANHSDLIASHICVLLKQGCVVSEIISKLKWENTRSNRRFIRDIRNLKIYTHISKTYKLPDHLSERTPLKENVVRKICELFELELTYSQILNILGLERTSSTIAMLSSIRRGVTFKEITSEYNFKKDPHYIRRDNGYVSDICERLEQGFASKDILIDLGVPVTKNELHFISKVRNKLAFTSISSKYNI